MGDIMRPMSFGHLMNWILDEYAQEGSIFGVRSMPVLSGDRTFPIFGEKIETPFGPAAGPNTQLAQNIIAAYCAGSRFFELKTVQVMDGRELAACVPKPCIASGDECYNCEWSTELEVGQAFEEYVKAWVACHVIAREYGLGDEDGFVFNMSVGYDLEGIKSTKIDQYIEGMKDASETPVWGECIWWLKENKDRLRHVDDDFIASIPAQVSRSITESTLHGCPPDEIERIATYLITEKGLNTYIKCNPTILGYEFARARLDGLGYDYIAFDDHHFLEDLQWKDAVGMFERLTDLCAKEGKEFGLKLTNTFPVDVKAGELPSQEMYMSGRSLFPLTIEVARRVSEKFNGKLRISWSGGADAHNIRSLVDAGIWPVTMATTVLKPGGYDRMAQIASLLEDVPGAAFGGIDTAAVSALSEGAASDPYYRKPIKPLPNRKREGRPPLTDCFTAPCRTGCPIGQDIPAYLEAMAQGRAEDALRIILERNPLPFITGTICPHTCEDRCMRNYYEESVDIRGVKLEAAKAAASLFEKAAASSEAAGDINVAVVGGGPTGIAAASFLSREGAKVTIFERRESLGGVVRHVIPAFRISDEAIESDLTLALPAGVEVKTGTSIDSVDALLEEGYTHVILAIGAWKEGGLKLEAGEAADVIGFLEKAKAQPDTFSPGKHIVVVGGGNTAMDAARAAKRLPGVESVSLVYRRTRRYMPADEEELVMALEDGVEFKELLSPVKAEDGMLTCAVMELGAPDESGRRSPVDTGRTQAVPADLVIAAVGEKVDSSLFEAAGIETDRKGLPVIDEQGRTSRDNVFAVGDCSRGPATVVKGIANAAAAAAAITGQSFERYADVNADVDHDKALQRHSVIAKRCSDTGKEGERCLGCAAVCRTCAEVCPNRANVSIRVPGLAQEQILHMDGMCNECGNCAVFCPYSGRPYKDKLTLFWSREDFDDSDNDGFLYLDELKVLLRLDGETQELDLTADNAKIPGPVKALIGAVITEHSYLLAKED